MSAYQTEKDVWSTAKPKKLIKLAKRSQHFKLAKKIVNLVTPMMVQTGFLTVSNSEHSDFFMTLSVSESRIVTLAVFRVPESGQPQQVFQVVEDPSKPPDRHTIKTAILAAAFLVNFPEYVVSSGSGVPLCLIRQDTKSFLSLDILKTALENGESQFRLGLPDTKRS